MRYENPKINSHPPPKHAPCTAATVGNGRDSISVGSLWASLDLATPSWVERMDRISWISAPAIKISGLLLTKTIPLICGVLLKSLIIFSNSSPASVVILLIFSPSKSKVITAMGKLEFSVTRTLNAFMQISPKPSCPPDRRRYKSWQAHAEVLVASFLWLTSPQSEHHWIPPDVPKQWLLHSHSQALDPPLLKIHFGLNILSQTSDFQTL